MYSHHTQPTLPPNYNPAAEGKLIKAHHTAYNHSLTNHGTSFNNNGDRSITNNGNFNRKASTDYPDYFGVSSDTVAAAPVINPS